jgi:small nuclear ribonucleoprotein D2
MSGPVRAPEDGELHNAPLSEEERFRVGPYSVLTRAVEKQTQVLIHCRNNKKLLARVKVFDRHCNMILQDVTEFSEPSKKAAAKKSLAPRERFIRNLFLRGDTVVVVLLNPFEQGPTIGAPSGSLS